MIRILICSNATFQRNGQTGVIMNLYRHLDRTIFKCDFVTKFVCDPEYKKEIEKNGDRIYILQRNMSNIRRYVHELREIASKGNYDILHIHGSSSTLALEMMALYSKIPVIITHSHNSNSSSRLVHYIFRPLVRLFSNKRLACGEKAGKWMYGSNSSFTIINNGVDTSIYRFNPYNRQKIRKTLGWEDSLIYGHIGNFIEVKNQSFVLDIFEEIVKKQDNARLIFLGKGIKMDEIKVKAKTKGLESKIHFAGSVNNVDEYLSAMDVNLMPSLYEGFPLTLVEAQATGLPSLVSDVITNLCNITGIVYYKSLEDTPTMWAECAIHISNQLDRDKICEKCISNITESGYAVNETAIMLMNIYKQLAL